MASILSLPDELIELLGIATERHAGIKAWCGLTSTCRRLWRLQLPDSHQGVTIGDNIKFEGVVWTLRRVRAAPWLHIYMPHPNEEWRRLRGPRAELANSLQEHCQAAAAASRVLKHLRVLDVSILIHEDPDTPVRVAGLVQQWTQALLWGSDKLEALMISANLAPCPPVLGCLPKLRYLELRLWQPGAWLEHFFVDLSFCSCLESLKLGQPALDPPYDIWKLPEVQLSALPSLQRVELTNCFPNTKFHLPPDCELCVSVLHNQDYPWEEVWRGMQGHLTVLSLIDLWLSRWPKGLEQLSRLQYLRMECRPFLGQDLAVLKAIPHVNLEIDGMAELSLTDGTWQSLEVHGMGGLRLDLGDADAFVRGTERFLFILSGRLELSQPLFTSIKAACSRQFKSCYQSKHGYPQNDTAHTVRLSNCEDVMRLEPSSNGKLTPSGGVRDGYAGTPETSPIWHQLGYKSLVSKEQFWPTWEPHTWVFGQ